MTTAFSSGTYTSTNDATFRAWITALHDLMIAAGFVQTTDTGQTDYATVLRPTTASTLVAGYRMYQFNDTLQATAPIFIKIEVGTGSAAGADFAWRIGVGASTNGAGTLTGVTITTGIVPQAASNFPGVNNNWACHTAGAGWVVFNYESNSLGAMFGFAIFRTRDDAGALSGEGASVYLRTASTGTGTASMLRFTATAAVLANQVANIPGLFPFAVTESKVGVDVQFFPHWTLAPRVRLNPFVFGYMTPDLAHGSPITTAVIDGTSRTYMPLSGHAICAGGSGAVSASHSAAYVWE